MKSERESQAIDPDRTVQVRRRESIDAHALDLGGAPDSSLEMRWYAANERRKRLFWIVAAAVAMSGAILLVGLGRRAMAASEEELPVLSSVTVVGMRAPDAKPESTSESRMTNAPSPGAMPSVDIASLPVASTGRILGARGRRLVVDGVVVSGEAAIVQCGKRAIKVGKRKARMIDVPCGGEVTIR